MVTKKLDGQMSRRKRRKNGEGHGETSHTITHAALSDALPPQHALPSKAEAEELRAREEEWERERAQRAQAQAHTPSKAEAAEHSAQLAAERARETAEAVRSTFVGPSSM